MNSFGRIFRLNIFGESHGPSVGIVLDGILPGIPVHITDFEKDLDRRRGGSQSGTTTRTEADIPEFISGVFNGFTTGAPLTIVFKNNNIKSEDYAATRNIPRPGHADFVAEKKFKGFQDYRGGGHFSGRLTVCMVAAGVMAKKMLVHLGTSISANAYIKEIGGEANIEDAIEKAHLNNDSIGGIIECVTQNIPVGLGEPFFDSLESLLSHAIFAIPAIKGIEFGAGFTAAGMKGIEHNDALSDHQGKTLTNHAGGISGGISNGNDLVFRVAVKPTSSTPNVQTSLNTLTGQMESFVVKGRHDLSIALRVPVVVEAVTNCVLADLLLLS